MTTDPAVQERINRNRVPCLKCRAAAYRLCVGPKGHALYTVHAARRSAAADAGIYTP